MKLPPDVKQRLSRLEGNGSAYSAVPAYLRLRPCWAVHRGKVPFDPVKGIPARVSSEDAWRPFDVAVAAVLEGDYDGIGYLLRERDDVVGVDLDNCRDANTGAIHPWAQHLVRLFRSYTEVSLSGRGLHIICRGALPEGARKSGSLEIYNSRRFFVVTGDVIAGAQTLRDCQQELDAVVPVLGPLGKSLGDETFAQLFGGNLDGYASPSEADLALCSRVRSRDRHVIRDIQLLSGLRREKHDREDYVERTIDKVLQPTPEPEPKSQATLLVELAADDLLFHDVEGEAFVGLQVSGHTETWPLGSRRYKDRIAERFYRRHGRVPTAQALADAFMVLRARALFSGPEMRVFSRVAEVDGKFFLDLADAEWRAVEIGVAWRIVESVPVRFRRTRGTEPLPAPIATKRTLLELLEPLINVEEADLPLVLCWLVASVFPTGPYPILVLTAEQGAGKSTCARVLRSLVDPNSAPLRSQPRDERDLAIAARNGHVLAFDNLSYITVWFSDGLCRVATGIGFATRQLYSDADEVLLQACRPVMLNGIEELPSRGDLIDRSLMVSLPRIAETRRMPEDKFWRLFEERRPEILGALLNAVAAARVALPSIDVERLPRLADFYRRALAAEEAIGLERGSFHEAFRRSRETANAVALEAAPVADAVQALMESRKREWRGTATQLLAELEFYVDADVRRTRAWPKAAHALGNSLRRLAPNLRRVGVDVRFEKQGRGNERARVVVLERRDKRPSPSSPVSGG